ncbi:MAG TPA: hypothetical protein PKD26_07675 [Pyrinomonadaceae bacterium]|nr:hypothetical protein [Pyrinomonadaceae bacterium]
MRIKLFFALVSGLIVIAWYAESGLYSQRPVVLDTETKSADEESLFRHLAERSDFIGVVKLIGSETIVDPVIRKAEIDLSVRTSTLPSNRAVKGYVYEVQVVTPVLTKPSFKKRKMLKVYSIGEPYSLHTRMVRFVPGREYLLFATKANKTEVQSSLETVDRQNPLMTKRVDVEEVVLVTGGQSGARLLEGDDQLVRKIKAIVRKL